MGPLLCLYSCPRPSPYWRPTILNMDGSSYGKSARLALQGSGGVVFPGRQVFKSSWGCSAVIYARFGTLQTSYLLLGAEPKTHRSLFSRTCGAAGRNHILCGTRKPHPCSHAGRQRLSIWRCDPSTSPVKHSECTRTGTPWRVVEMNIRPTLQPSGPSVRQRHLPRYPSQPASRGKRNGNTKRKPPPTPTRCASQGDSRLGWATHGDDFDLGVRRGKGLGRLTMWHQQSSLNGESQEPWPLAGTRPGCHRPTSCLTFPRCRSINLASYTCRYHSDSNEVTQ